MKMSDLDIPKSKIIILAEEYVWNARNKAILMMKVEGATYEEIAETYNLSTVRVKEIVKQAVTTIYKHI